jgi:hypothetical protein
MSFKRLVLELFGILGVLLAPCVVRGVEAQSDCLPSIQVTFSTDGLSVYVVSDKDLSNVVLKFCDGSSDYKFDNLSGLTGTFTYLAKELAGVWVKSGCNESGDGPGYGEFFGRVCGGGDSDPKVKICHIPDGITSEAQTIEVPETEVAFHLAHGDVLGECPVDTSCADCAGVPNGGAQVDCCGVCQGNNKSCLGRCGGCNTLKIRRSWLQNLVGLVNSIRVNSAKQLRCNKGSALEVKSRQNQANQLFQEGVFLVYELFNHYPGMCGIDFCQGSAADSIRLQLESMLAKLYNLNREAKENAAKGCGRSCKKKSARR